MLSCELAVGRRFSRAALVAAALGASFLTTGCPFNDHDHYDAFCGDGYVDSGEECDDGNLYDGDGCSTSCVASSIEWVGDSIDFMPTCSTDGGPWDSPLAFTVTVYASEEFTTSGAGGAIMVDASVVLSQAFADELLESMADQNGEVIFEGVEVSLRTDAAWPGFIVVTTPIAPFSMDLDADSNGIAESVRISLERLWIEPWPSSGAQLNLQVETAVVLLGDPVDGPSIALGVGPTESGASGVCILPAGEDSSLMLAAGD